MTYIYFVKDEQHKAIKYHLALFINQLYYHTELEEDILKREVTRKEEELFRKLIVSRTTQWCDTCKAFFMYLRFHQVELRLFYTQQEIHDIC